MESDLSDLRRLIWTDCQMRGEGVVAHGVGQGIKPAVLVSDERFVIGANGVDYEVIVVSYATDSEWAVGRWTVEDVGSAEGRNRDDSW